MFLERFLSLLRDRLAAAHPPPNGSTAPGNPDQPVSTITSHPPKSLVDHAQGGSVRAGRYGKAIEDMDVKQVPWGEGILVRYWECMDRLSEQEWNVVRLKFGYGMRGAQIARALNIAPSTVCEHLKHAGKKQTKYENWKRKQELRMRFQFERELEQMHNAD